MSNNIKKILFSKGFIIGIGIIFGITSSFAITVDTIETQWSINDFDVGDKITQNMLMGKILGYTCNNTDCSQKIYWKKISTSTSVINDASVACETIGMTLPSSEQIGHFAGNNNKYGLDMGVYKVHNSMANAGSYHHTATRTADTNYSSCSTGYSCDYYDIRVPNSYSSHTTSWGYSARYYYCVYKRWN